MKNFNACTLAMLLLPMLFSICTVCPISFAQKKPVTVCRQSVFDALQQLPKLEYDCPEGLIESDDKILKLPVRIAALKNLTKELESLTDAAWWQANVDELSLCELHGRPGALTDEEKQKIKGGDYQPLFDGNHEIRVVMTIDPCYQAGYNGSILFLLYRKGGQSLRDQTSRWLLFAR